MTWSFAPTGVAGFGGRTYVALQVIWAIGASMVVLAGAQFLGRRACLAIGAAILLGHNLLDAFWPAAMTSGSTAPLWAALHSRQLYEVGPFRDLFLLSVAALDRRHVPRLRRRGSLRATGETAEPTVAAHRLSLVIAFILIRALNVYGDPHPWDSDPSRTAASIMSFLGTTKYPPSLLYILMTLGPAAIACAFVDRLHGPIRDALVTLGRAPLAFYIAHLYLIHAVAIVLGIAQGFAAAAVSDPLPLLSEGFGVGLSGVYLIWIAVVVILYPLCRWVAAVKARRQDWWLSYV